MRPPDLFCITSLHQLLHFFDKRQVCLFDFWSISDKCIWSNFFFFKSESADPLTYCPRSFYSTQTARMSRLLKKSGSHTLGSWRSLWMDFMNYSNCSMTWNQKCMSGFSWQIYFSSFQFVKWKLLFGLLKIFLFCKLT